MALHKKKPSEIPSDAVILSPEEALVYEWKIINGWQESKDVWALLYGPGILAGVSAATGVFINHYYRKKLKLGKFGLISTYLPIVFLPAFGTLTLHKIFIQRKIILDPDVCPVCVEVRSALIQTVVGIGYPAIIAPFAAFMFATRHYTYRLPSITEEPKAVFMLMKKMTKPIVGRLAFSFAAHVVASMLITFKEMENYYNVQNKLIAFEEQLENGA